MRRNIAKKTWGVLGKQQTFYSPGQYIQDKPKVPLNNTPVDAWDYKKSKYYRVDLVPMEVQQGGVVPQATSAPVVSPTPTPSITPSSTPIVFPTPDLWFDATDSSTMFLVLSGGTTFVDKWASKGTSTWEMSAATAVRRPILSASTQMPDGNNIVRFTFQSLAANRQGLSSFNNTPIPHTGITCYYIFSQPLQPSAFGTNGRIQVYSGLTNGGVSFISGFFDDFTTIVWNTANITTQINSNAVINNIQTGAWTGNMINNNVFLKMVIPQSGFSYYELNSVDFTGTTPITAYTLDLQWNAIALGINITSSAGTQTYSTNNNIEFGEIMIYNKELSQSEQQQVEDYLKDKWRYSDWVLPTPTPSASPTVTPTPSPTA